jgi:drug/metabolite transporter (DMT)-like permease
MSRRAWTMLMFVSAFWGSSYLFIKVSLDEGVSPGVIVFGRVALSALVLLPLAAQRGALRQLHGRLGAVVLLSLVQVVAPFLLISFGEREIASSLTGILVATVPVFTFLLAFALEGEERAGALSLVGVGVGILGVALLLGLDAEGGRSALVGGLMVVLASLGYAIGAWYLKRHLSDAEPLSVLAGTMTTTAIVTLPVALLGLPDPVPSVKAAAALTVLGLLCTAITFLLFYSLVAGEGPARASLVGYIAPAFSVFYGVTLYGEHFTVTTAAGLALIVVGSWLAAEGRPPWRGGRLKNARPAARRPRRYRAPA